MTETDMAYRMRDMADKLQIMPMPMADVIELLRKGADEVDRYHGGMVAWKKTAETKDAKLSAEMTDRINERVAARLAAAPAQAGPSDDAKDAARYRYLRGRSFGAEPKDGMRFMLAVPEPAPNGWRIHSVRDEKMDAAIDAAIQRRS